jgi:hypothetical protein
MNAIGSREIIGELRALNTIHAPIQVDEPLIVVDFSEENTRSMILDRFIKY